MGIQITAMDERHLDQAFALTRCLNWPHRRADWLQAFSLGQGVVATENGKLVGTALYWRWGKAYATVGLVIVAQDSQGKGVGRKLMQATLAELDGVNVRLHATERGKVLYEKLGFVAVGQIMQLQTPQLAMVSATALAAEEKLRPARREESATLVALDTRAHGQHRPELILSLFDGTERFIVLEKQGRIVGFACQRRFGHGQIIGPIIAEEVAQARVMVSELLSGLTGQFVRIDTEGQSGLSDWLNTLGMRVVDAPVMMIRGKPWQADGVLSFGLMTQAMG